MFKPLSMENKPASINITSRPSEVADVSLVTVALAVVPHYRLVIYID